MCTVRVAASDARERLPDLCLGAALGARRARARGASAVAPGRIHSAARPPEQRPPTGRTPCAGWWAACSEEGGARGKCRPGRARSAGLPVKRPLPSRRSRGSPRHRPPAGRTEGLGLPLPLPVFTALPTRRFPAAAGC